jgi:hypothetical protein
VDLHKTYADPHKTNVDLNKTYADPHKINVDPLKTYASPHKTNVDIHKSYADPHKTNVDLLYVQYIKLMRIPIKHMRIHSTAEKSALGPIPGRICCSVCHRYFFYYKK